MNLLILTTTFPKSMNDFGTPRFVYDLAYNISQYRIKTIVLTPDRPDSSENNEKISEYFFIHRFRYFIKKHQNLTKGDGIVPSIKKSKTNFLLIPFLIIKQFFLSVIFLKKYKIEIISSHWLIPSGFIGVIIQKLYRKKNYVTIHAAALYLFEKILLGKLIAKFIYKNSTKLFVVSNFGKNRFYELISKPNKEKFDGKVKVIPMGVYTENFSGEEKN